MDGKANQAQSSLSLMTAGICSHQEEIEAEVERANAIIEETPKKYPSLVKAKLAAARAVSSA